jgi:hypothetical protein
MRFRQVTFKTQVLAGAASAMKTGDPTGALLTGVAAVLGAERVRRQT